MWVLEAETDSATPNRMTEYAASTWLADYLHCTRATRGGAALRPGHRPVEALAAIHAASVIHRDLKPANGLLTESGR